MTVAPDEPDLGVSVVAKACRVLRVFSTDVGVLSVRQVSARAGIPRSTTHELCQTLVSEGMLERLGNGYQLGPQPLELAGHLILRTGLLSAGEGVLERVAQQPEQVAQLCQLSGGWVFVFARASGGRRVPMHETVGKRLPAHRDACGKAALSWLPADDVVDRVRRACREESLPVPDPHLLQRELDAARRDGCVILHDHRRSETAIGAPILDGATRPLGGVAVTIPSASTKNIDAAASAVMEAAGAISMRLMRISPNWA